MTALDEAIDGFDAISDGSEEKARKQSDVLSTHLFHAPDGTGYADVSVEGHRETWPIRSKGFRRWWTRRYYLETDSAPNAEALNAALSVLEAQATVDGPARDVYVRLANVGDKIYLDLCNSTWQTVEIYAEGWRIVDNPPVRFRRAPGMLPSPAPVAGGSIEALEKFLNTKTKPTFVLAVTWILQALRGKGPSPVEALVGEQGTAKSTFSWCQRALVDPNSVPLRSLPRDDRDLFIAATNSHVLAFDNVSGLQPWLSDALCRIASGGGFSTRQLYTDSDEVLFDAQRPIILNGIEDIVTRADLADRAILLTLSPIPDEKRKSEEELKADFEAARPAILGVLLDGVAHGLARLPFTKLDRLQRMADFALWGTACETAFWEKGTFQSAYAGNREEAVETILEGDPVAVTLRALMKDRTKWTGTASALLRELDEKADEGVKRSKTWPKVARSLSNRLRRAAPFLRTVGIEISQERNGRARNIQIVARIAVTPNGHAGTSADPAGGELGTGASFASPSSPQLETPGATNGSGELACDANLAGQHFASPVCVTATRLEPVTNDASDAGDANSPPVLGSIKRRVWRRPSRATEPRRCKEPRS